MCTVIELNFLKSFACNSMCHDDMMRPKSIVFGDAVRRRIPSQSSKFAERCMLSKDVLPTKRAHDYITRSLYKADHPDATEEELQLFNRKCAALLNIKPEKNTDPSQSKNVSCVWTKDELGAVYQFLCTMTEEENELLDKLVKAMYSSKSQSDSEEKENNSKNTLKILRKRLVVALEHLPLDQWVAMYGRFVAEVWYSGMNVASSVKYNHAYSVDSDKKERDYFSKVDAVSMMYEDITGGSYIGDDLCGANIFYFYRAIDPHNALDNIVRNLKTILQEEKKTIDEIRKAYQACATALSETVVRVIRAMLLTAPVGKQNSMASMPVPNVCMITMLKDGFPLTMDSAFVDVISNSSGSVVKQAFKRMDDYVKKTRPKQEFLMQDALIDTTLEYQDDTLPDFERHYMSELEDVLDKIRNLVKDNLFEYIETDLLP